MSLLGNRERRLLLKIARRAMTCRVEGSKFLADIPGEAALRQSCGAFVTLHKHGRLRGCIGQLPAEDSLVEVVEHCAIAAALEDPRFAPVRLNELGDIEIELSVLSPLFEIKPEQIIPGKQGLLVARGQQRGILLPQVAAEHHWTAERFLEETCLKAGLRKDAWKDEATRIMGFTAEVFSESSLQQDENARRRTIRSN